MILHKKGRLYVGKLSFALPDNVYLQTDDTCVYYASGLEMESPDHMIRLSVYADLEEHSSKGHIDGLLKKPLFIRKSETKPITVGGLQGHYAYYESGAHSHCEYRFDAEPTEHCNGITILVYVDKSVDIVNICQGELVQQLVQSVRAEP